MRWQTVSLSLRFLLLLTSVPTPSAALTVVISQGATTLVTRQSLVTQPDPTTMVPTTVVDLSGIPATTLNGFTITCSLCSDPVTAAPLIPQAMAQQSGSVEKVILDNVTITAPATCSGAAPCSLTITASSDPSDFPTAKPPGGYPSGVLMSGFFSGPASVSPAGDTISGVGRGQGDVINATPGGGPADTEVSMPSSCTGSLNCAFTATTTTNSFNDQIAETIQLNCGPEALSCTPSLTSQVRVTFVNPGDSVDLPFATGQSRTHAAAPLIEPAGVLVPFSAGAPFATFSPKMVNIIGLTNFKVEAPFTLNAASNGIDPLREFVNFQVGTYAATIPPGSFSKNAQGFFVFNGFNRGVALQAVLIPLGGADWEFQVEGRGANLTGTENPVPVGLTIKDDTGTASVTARFR